MVHKIIPACLIAVMVVFFTVFIVWAVHRTSANTNFRKRCETQSGTVFYNDYFHICVKDDRVIIREDY